MLLELGEEVLSVGRRLLVREVDRGIAWPHRVEELFQMPRIVGPRLDEVNLFLGKFDHLCRVDNAAQLV